MSLRIEYADSTGKSVIVTADKTGKSELFIGRRDGDFSPDVSLAWDHSVARRHARIYYEYNTWFIEQLAEANLTRVKTVPLVPGVPHELPEKAEIVVGKQGKSVLHCQRVAETIEPMPDGILIDRSRMAPPEAEVQVSETRRIEILSSIAAAVSQPAEIVLQTLVDEFRRDFPAAESVGIALYHDREISVPAAYPRGRAHISFTLARRAITTRQAVCWDRAAASLDSQPPSSLEGTLQALYAPVFRGARPLGVIYLHTRRAFADADQALLTTIAEILGSNPQFQPEAASDRLPSVFISYSHQNLAIVKQLAAELRRQRVRVWFDERLRSGQAWQTQLAQAIRQSDAFALVMSPASLDSSYVQWEIAQAQEVGKLIFPLWYQPCDSVPPEIDRLQRIDIGSDYQSGVLKLVEDLYEAVEAQVVAVQAPVPVKTQAAAPGKKIRILFLAANPRDTSPLRLGEEVRTIQERLRSAEYRDRFDEPIQG
jgi:hypothetical protein